jgi:hypothetical protein
MKDLKHIFLFSIIGLALAWFVSSPLRKPIAARPQVGTPMSEGKVYASGTVALAPGLESAAARAGALFIIVRTPQPGAPIAAKRMPIGAFPVTFSITEKDNMAGEGYFDGDIRIIARLDQDGAAGLKGPGDIEGFVDIRKGDERDVVVTISPDIEK